MPVRCQRGWRLAGPQAGAVIPFALDNYIRNRYGTAHDDINVAATADARRVPYFVGACEPRAPRLRHHATRRG